MSPEDLRAWLGAAMHQHDITPESLLGRLLDGVPAGEPIFIAPALGITFEKP